MAASKENKPTDADLSALEEAIRLREIIAGDHILAELADKTTFEELSLRINQAYSASQKNTWTQEIAKDLWDVYGRLRDLVPFHITKSEEETLNYSQWLLQYADENISSDKIRPEWRVAIRRAIDARRSNIWTPQLSRDFWDAFGHLCDATRPVTIGTLRATKGVASKTANIYSIILLVLLIATISLQLFMSFPVFLSQNIDASLKAIAAQETDLLAQYTLYEAKSPADDDTRLSAQKEAALDELADGIVAKSYKLEVDTLQAINYSRELSYALRWPLKLFNADRIVKEDLPEPCHITGKKINVDNRYKCTLDFTAPAIIEIREAKAWPDSINSIWLSIILPMLLGATGAASYIVRHISEQIRTCTFTYSSTIRHRVRFMLGILAGIAVGLCYGISPQFNLPMLVLSFIVGYAVEPVFSVIDDISGRFKKDGSK